MFLSVYLFRGRAPLTCVMGAFVTPKKGIIAEALSFLPQAPPVHVIVLACFVLAGKTAPRRAPAI